MKKRITLFCLLLIGLLLVGCGGNAMIESISIIGNQNEYTESLNLSDLTVLVKMSDGSEERVALIESMLDPDDLEKLNQVGTHALNITYKDAKATLTFTIKEEQKELGKDGREVLLRIHEGFIQWQSENDIIWKDLISTTTLKGDAGIAGRDIELQITDLHIQWRYVNEDVWQNLISIATIRGIAGQDGRDGRELELQVTSEYIQWRYLDETSWQNLIALSLINGSKGDSGRELELQTTSEYIQWRYAGEENWRNLINLSIITGPVGAKGDSGLDGKQVEFQRTADYIQWRYNGETKWTNLIALEELKGQAGQMPLIEISADGYWVINGLKTDSKVNTIEYFNIEFIVDSFTELDLKSIENIEEGTTVELPIPKKEGLTFVGWFTEAKANSGQFSNHMPVVSNLKLYPKFVNSNLNITLNDFFNLFYFDTPSFSLITKEIATHIKNDKSLKLNSYQSFDYYNYDISYVHGYSVKSEYDEYLDYYYVEDDSSEFLICSDLTSSSYIIYNESFVELYPDFMIYSFIINKGFTYKQLNANKYCFVLDDIYDLYMYINEELGYENIANVNYSLEIDLDQVSIKLYLEINLENGEIHLIENE